MRSTRDDSTPRARIRDAAIRLIGEGGFAATSARAVAAEAGVSAGLVIHHFGTMRGLKTACDEFIISEITHIKTGMDSSDMTAVLTEWYSDLDRYQPWLNYLSRLFTDDSDAGAELFDRMLTMTANILDEGVAGQQMRPSSDAHARALLLVTQSLATLILQGHIARTLSSERFSLESLSRMGNAALEMYTEGLYVGSSMLDATRQATNTARHATDTARNRGSSKGQGYGPTP
ncbi:TetR family transcriptional regulator [Rhodoglobus vestalii]|uniref:TetR family transcriptional regulator n=1 Tax=Rhodoglobus vestalii TaxID=193384 RepID=A0A8H2PV52_9MICO|nr:TetR family transcriptional regulator [Rhodoglobus vestalii]TQO20467.1 TetR family transcriptional regulator [Rhodoglobus vestalii]